MEDIGNAQTSFTRHLSDAAQCFAQGLILETCGGERQVVKLLPPLTMTDDVLEQGLVKFEAAFETNGFAGHVFIGPSRIIQTNDIVGRLIVGVLVGMGVLVGDAMNQAIKQ